MTAEKKSESGFEQDLEKLEAVVAALEEGGLPLDKALKQFETGILLTRKCEKALRDAEQKIEILVRGMDGALEPQPFVEEAAPAAESSKPIRENAVRPSAQKTAHHAPAPWEDLPPEEEEDDDTDELF